MAPKKKPKPATAAAAAPPRRAPEAITETSTSKKGNVIVKEIGWKPHAAAPVIMGRNLSLVDGARSSRRPSMIARKEGKKSITEVAWADAYEQPDDWEDADERMPSEKYESDCGWYAGPAQRSLPAFKGKEPGPADASLTHLSTTMELLRTQLTGEFMAKTVEYTIEHAKAYRVAHPRWHNSSIERGFRDYETRCTPVFVWLWLACRVRISCLKPELPAQLLWDQHSHLFDAQVCAVMTHSQFLWMNRHCTGGTIRFIMRHL